MCPLYQPGGFFGPRMGSASSDYRVHPLSMHTGYILLHHGPCPLGYEGLRKINTKCANFIPGKRTSQIGCPNEYF